MPIRTVFALAILLLSLPTMALEHFFLRRAGPYDDPMGVSIYVKNGAHFIYSDQMAVTSVGAPLRKNIYLTFEPPSDIMPPWTESEYVASWVDNNKLVISRRQKTIAFLDMNCIVYDPNGVEIASCTSADKGSTFVFKDKLGKEMAIAQKMNDTRPGYRDMDWQVFAMPEGGDVFKAVGLIFAASKISGLLAENSRFSLTQNQIASLIFGTSFSSFMSGLPIYRWLNTHIRPAILRGWEPKT